jgi:hypothetical protein
MRWPQAEKALSPKEREHFLNASDERALAVTLADRIRNRPLLVVGVRGRASD